jgi:phosphatidylglycerophosphatase A
MKTEAPISTASMPQAAAPVWAELIATVFEIGRLRPGPGTWASLAAVLIWFGLARWISGSQLILVVLIVAAIAAGIPAATRVARASRTKDPGFVVIDEVAGQWITLLFAPVTWKSLLVGFILFRGFDIVKPPPVRQLEALPEGTGIVMDDVAAGVYAWVVMQLLLHYGLLSR